MIKERPILFNTEMVQAILQGRKSQTRRICKHFDAPKGGGVKCPYGEVDDILWVKETYFKTQDTLTYKASFDENLAKKMPGLKWKPSIFMPKALSRIKLRITGVRVERLQDITEEDCIKEGIRSVVATDKNPYYKDYHYPDVSYWFENAQKSYQSLWERINGKKSWEENPFVWVIEFECL